MDDIFKKKWSDKLINHKKSGSILNITSISDLANSIKNNQNALFLELKKHAKNFVLSSGPENSPLMIIGEAPGKEEDETGLPFVGDSGKLLNKMLDEVGINREKVYVTNVVNWRPENNRRPTDEEIDAFRPFLYEHIKLKNPKIIFVLGSVAMKALNISGSITEARGTVYSHDGRLVLLSFHPSYLLRVNNAKFMALKDFQLLKIKLEENNITLD